MIVCDPVLAHMLVKHGVDDLYKGISSAVTGGKVDLEDYLVRKSLMVAADSMLLACQAAGVGDYSLTAGRGDDLQSVGQEVANQVLDVVQRHATELFTDVACNQVLDFCIRKLTSSLIETCLGTYRRECEQTVRKALESSLNKTADRAIAKITIQKLGIADFEKQKIIHSQIFGALDSQPLAAVVPTLLSLASQGAGLQKEWDKALVAVQLADQALRLLRMTSLDVHEELPHKLKEIASSVHTDLLSEHPAHVVQKQLDSDEAKEGFQQLIKSTTDAVVNARCDAIRAELQELPGRVLRPMVRQSADQAFFRFRNLVNSSLQCMNYPSQRQKVQDFQEVGEEHVDDRKGRPLTKSERLAKSRKQGREWEEEILNTQQRNLAIEQVTLEPFGPDGKPVKNLKTGKNLEVRIDAVLLPEKAEHKIRLLEAKNGPKAPLTKNQRIGYPLLQMYGGRVVSPKMKERGYSTVPPTKVEIIRPANGQVWSKGKVDQ